MPGPTEGVLQPSTSVAELLDRARLDEDVAEGSAAVL